MTGCIFLIAASPYREYGWVLIPSRILPHERGTIMRLLPQEISEVPQTVFANSAVDVLRFICVTRLIVCDKGIPTLDRHGRNLRQTFGLMFINQDRSFDEQSDLLDAERQSQVILQKFIVSKEWKSIISNPSRASIFNELKRFLGKIGE